MLLFSSGSARIRIYPVLSYLFLQPLAGRRGSELQGSGLNNNNSKAGGQGGHLSLGHRESILSLVHNKVCTLTSTVGSTLLCQGTEADQHGQCGVRGVRVQRRLPGRGGGGGRGAAGQGRDEGVKGIRQHRGQW